MSGNKRQQSERRLRAAKFCPWCGTATLKRDEYPENWRDKPPAFICSTCNAGFTLNRSPRVEFAIELFSRERPTKIIGRG